MINSEVIMTNLHPRGFSFGCRTDNGDGVFFPPSVTNNLSVGVGEVTGAILVPNGNNNTCPWKAAAVTKEAVVAQRDHVDIGADLNLSSDVLRLLEDGEPRTVDALVEASGLSHADVLLQAQHSRLPRIQIVSHDGVVMETYLIGSKEDAVIIIEGDQHL